MGNFLIKDKRPLWVFYREKRDYLFFFLAAAFFLEAFFFFAIAGWSTIHYAGAAAHA
jgi:hypothetical protein